MFGAMPQFKMMDPTLVKTEQWQKVIKKDMESPEKE
jgi:hypothetical protein